VTARHWCKRRDEEEEEEEEEEEDGKLTQDREENSLTQSD